MEDAGTIIETYPTARGALGGGTRDTRLFERAIRERWKIPEKAFADAPDVMHEIIMDPSRKDRDRIAAAKALIGMHGQNIGADAPQSAPGVTVNVGVAVGTNSNELATEKPAAVRAAADWIAAVADDAGDAGGVRLVRDEGEVCDSPPS